MKKIVLISLLILLGFPSLAQQEAQFSQYVFNGLYTNPAYAGHKEAIYMQAFYRSQWTGVKGAPQSLSLAVDAPIPTKNLGIGAIFTKDKIGAQSSLNGYMNLAYRLRLSHNPFNILSVGIGAGVLQSSLNGNMLDAEQIGDTRIPVGFESKLLPDLRAGIQLATEHFLIGLSVNNLFSKSLTSINDAVLGIQPHYYLTAAANFGIYPEIDLKPSFLIKDDRHGPASLDLNAFLVFKDRFSIGAAYRTSTMIFSRPHLQNDLTKRSAVGLISDFVIQKRYRIGYAFDYSLNKLGSFDYGSHEVSVGYYFTLAKERSKFFFCF